MDPTNLYASASAQSDAIAIRQVVERTIAARVVLDAIAAGYSLTVNNGGDKNEISPTQEADTVLRAMFATDDEHLFFSRDGKQAGFVYFVYGNDGTDVISDYTLCLENVVDGANCLSNQIEAGKFTITVP